MRRYLHSRVSQSTPRRAVPRSARATFTLQLILNATRGSRPLQTNREILHDADASAPELTLSARAAGERGAAARRRRL